MVVMAFVKHGDPQPIECIIKSGTEEEDKKTKKALNKAMQDAKNINEDGNKIESIKKN